MELAAFPMLVALLQPTYYQLRVTMCEVDPPIWRRILVSKYIRFYALHSAIQDAFGWTSSYVYQFIRFSTQSPEFSITTPLTVELDPFIVDYFLRAGDNGFYRYNFVKRWRFHIVLENITQLELRVPFPMCVAGRHGGPPETIGSVEAFQSQWAIATDRNNPQRQASQRILESMGYSYQFDIQSVLFKNHIERFRLTNGR